MVQAVNAIAKMGALNMEERTLFTVAYRNVMESHYHSLRAFTLTILGAAHRKWTAQYQKKLEKNVRDVLFNGIDLLESYLLPTSEVVEDFVLYHTMKGDMFRLVAEFTSGVTRHQLAQFSLDAYEACMLSPLLAPYEITKIWLFCYANMLLYFECSQSAYEFAKALPSRHPLCIALSINLSSMLHNIFNLPHRYFGVNCSLSGQYLG
uniref:14-3-3 domain-containing protein n=1 Tax=Leersia perrieri TaxID=77586 RepID=A0A0D9WBV3_9ORYZ